jgi:hypothetical protein
MSTALFSLLIFFSVTGITLNHLDWVSSTKDPKLWQGEVDQIVLQNFTPPANDSLLRWMQNKHSLVTASNIEWDEDAQEVLLDYPYPAGYAYVIVNVSNGQYSIDYQIGSFWQTVNDLHKGRHAGQSWSWLIDISAVFMVLFSITGLIILWQNRPKRRVGITLTLLGTGTPILIFFLLVPNITGV